MSYQIELFHSLLNDFLKGESALLTIEGDVLAVRGVQGVSYGTLITAATTACKYLNLQEGDIALLNDPYSGGTILSEMTFITAVSEDLLWVLRKPLQKSVKLVKSVEEEGLRIPPTPLRQKNQLNEMILTAIQAHPACPDNFVDWLKEQCEDLTAQAKKLHEAIEYTGFTITGELIEEYVALCKKAATQKISERASGETRVDIVLDSGELLRMNMEIHDGKVSLDFSGTSAAKTLSLTESATYGVCFYALSRFYGFSDLANSGSFSVLDITKPTGCWLLGKYPAATFKGMTCGVAALEAALELALLQIHQKNEKALSSHCGLSFELGQKGKSLFMSLSGGEGAKASAEGACAHFDSFSVEKVERELPVKFIRIDKRNSTGGKGKHSGGRGLIVKLEAREEINATWLTDLTLHRPRISKNCSHGDVCEVSMEHQGTQKSLPVLGHQKLGVGDIISLCSGSGGGFGKES